MSGPLTVLYFCGNIATIRSVWRFRHIDRKKKKKKERAAHCALLLWKYCHNQVCVAISPQSQKKKKIKIKKNSVWSSVAISPHWHLSGLHKNCWVLLSPLVSPSPFPQSQASSFFFPRWFLPARSRRVKLKAVPQSQAWVWRYRH